jgi:hypothetical protein
MNKESTTLIFQPPTGGRNLSLWMTCRLLVFFLKKKAQMRGPRLESLSIHLGLFFAMAQMSWAIGR